MSYVPRSRIWLLFFVCYRHHVPLPMSYPFTNILLLKNFPVVVCHAANKVIMNLDAYGTKVACTHSSHYYLPTHHQFSFLPRTLNWTREQRHVSMIIARENKKNENERRILSSSLTSLAAIDKRLVDVDNDYYHHDQTNCHYPHSTNRPNHWHYTEHNALYRYGYKLAIADFLKTLLTLPLVFLRCGGDGVDDNHDSDDGWKCSDGGNEDNQHYGHHNHPSHLQ